MNRFTTRKVNIGGVYVGGDAPVAIQSMNNTDTRDVESTLRQIEELKNAGCDITRVAILNMEAAEALSEITKRSPLPVVADIHFDYRLALESIKNGASKIRINPGNIGGLDRVKAVADLAKERNIPIRVGVNSGSIGKDMLEKYGGVNADSLSQSALSSIRILEDCGFEDIVVSMKSSDPVLTIESYRLLRDQVPYPFHVGVTEAGTLREGIIRSSVGIGALLSEGIGDTIRVSLTDEPKEEVYAGISILRALGLRKGGMRLVSCPTCGRTQVPLIEVAKEVESRIRDLPYDMTVAVMGCAVNGPGEAREADVGIAGGVDEFLLFKKGEPVCKVEKDKAVDVLLATIEEMNS
ncbi:MAG: flavodoxin-dependent (E)-4-hydroxy-3-methylbut-2-enyl-diphosphate synthase [Clostridiales bacterium]|nr:flavodoxin-dependent (E)-4-hydroxy-3-methylbut-2-enyl-diphosphate synthase [Clostridiales bacterium]MBR6254934.1 flavodoxin-dependent (E)-4-hydroxy-3-methylbut-2-enyl-diphosphate synthase [Clostridiales bacterium]MCR5274404.1 flavodoxin-dependent (E)-4-hydroxy-3-methylbut-2-enyl-diphosphate synthase [Clostridiales bacterium]